MGWHHSRVPVVSHFRFPQGTNFDARYPFMILLGFFFVGSVAILFLPETLHQTLPETLHEAQQFGKDQPFWYMPKPFESSKAPESWQSNGGSKKLAVPKHHM